MRKFILVFSALMLLISCGKDSLNSSKEVLDREQVIEGLRISLGHFRDVKLNTSLRNDQLSIEEEYRDNLSYINSKTGLSLNFDKKELDAMIMNSPDLFLIDGPNLSEEAYFKNIEKMKANGSYEVFLEVQRILEEVYGSEDHMSAKGFSWGCGFALAGNFAATLGLAACGTGVGCPLAIASKALAMAGIATSCL